MFNGFPKGDRATVALPERFFSDLLSKIDDLAELKVTLYAMWALQQREGPYRYLRLRDFTDDPIFAEGMGSAESIRGGVQKSVARGTLIALQVALSTGHETFYFINTERGRNAAASLERGDWQPGEHDRPVRLTERPNIFVLYEQNIGPLTPLLAESLADAERSYPYEWLLEAIRAAVENNKRSWRYIEAILKRWETDGKPESKSAVKPPVSADGDVNPYLRSAYFQRKSGEE